MTMWLVWLGLVGCLVDVARGPDLGLCAQLPEGTYGYGEAGIGTCLAGPADLVFFQQDGGTFLAVTNADPYREFRSGSVLILDWDSIADTLRDTPPQRILASDASSWALELFDDDDGDGKAGNPYLGGFGYIPSSQRAVATSRLTEGLTSSATQNGLLRVGKDELYVFDLKNLESAGGGIERDGGTPELVLEDDPFPVIVDDAMRRVYVGNLTDHSISVLTSSPFAPIGCTTDEECDAPSGPLADGDTICRCDVATGPAATISATGDPDYSGSRSSISTLSVLSPKDIPEDSWTLTFVEGTVRAWVPTANPDIEIDGLVRYSSGDARNFEPSPFGFETGLGEVREPFIEVDASGSNFLYFAQSSGDLRRAASSPVGVAGEWLIDSAPLMPGLGGILGSPSVAPLIGEVGLYAELRSDETAAAEIVLGTSIDGAVYSFERTVLTPPAGLSYEDPFVAFDSLADRYRMWLSVRDGANYQIALSSSEDGRVWDEPVTVLSSPDRPLAAPTVAFLDGRYGMWLASGEVDRWDHAFSWSYDGVHWMEPEISITGAAFYDPIDPPRVAVTTDRIGSWRLEGADTGPLPLYLTSGSLPVSLIGFDLAVSNGQELENTIVSTGRAKLAIIPGSAIVTDGGRKLLYATTRGVQLRERIAVFEEIGGEFFLVTDPALMSDMLGLPPGVFASDPVIVRDGAGYLLYFTRWEDGIGHIHTSASLDGLTFGAASGAPLLAARDDLFDSAGDRPHSAQILSDGRVRLWYTGTDGSTSRIGSAIAPSPTGPFERDPGIATQWRLGTGLPGSFDDSGVSDPLIVTFNGATHLYYTGFDGTSQHLGHVTVSDGGAGEVVREIDPLTSLGSPAMNGLLRTFSAQGVSSPTLWSIGDADLQGTLDPQDEIELLYAGFDSTALRLGRATLSAGAPDAIFAKQRFATAGDTLSFATLRGGPGAQVIELAALLDEFVSQGFGMSAMALDEERGFLYVTTKLDDVLFVIDVRDDSDGTFIDSNVLDIEALVSLDTGNVFAGVRDIIVSPSRGLGYLTLKSPDGLAVIDLSVIPDDNLKEKIVLAPATILPMLSSLEDAGVPTQASFAGGRAALTADERLLIAPHFRGNGVSIFDLELDAFGREISWVPNIGENPHVVKISPDGEWAVVANYLGDVIDGAASSTLAFIDLRPDSDRYLEASTWLVNR